MSEGADALKRKAEALWESAKTGTLVAPKDAPPKPAEKPMAEGQDVPDPAELLGQRGVGAASLEGDDELTQLPPIPRGPAAPPPTVQRESYNFSPLGGKGVVTGIKDTYDNQTKLAGQMGELDAKLNTEQAGIVGSARELAETALKASKDRHDGEAAEIAKRQKEIASEADRLTNERVDAGKFYANPGNVISSLVLAVSPAFSRNMAGGKGLALANQALERDLETQKYNIQTARSGLEAKRNILHDYRQIMGSNDAGDMLYMAKANEVAAQKLQEAALKIGGQKGLLAAQSQIEGHKRIALEFMQRMAMVSHREAQLRDTRLVKASDPRYSSQDILSALTPGQPGQPPTQAEADAAKVAATVAQPKAEIPEESTADKLMAGSSHWGSGADPYGQKANPVAKTDAPVMTIPEVVISGKRLTPDLLKKAVANAGGGKMSAQQAAQAVVAKKDAPAMTIPEVVIGGKDGGLTMKPTTVVGDGRDPVAKYSSELATAANKQWQREALERTANIKDPDARSAAVSKIIFEKNDKASEQLAALTPKLEPIVGYVKSASRANTVFKNITANISPEQYNEMHKQYGSATLQGVKDAYDKLNANSEESKTDAGKEKKTRMESYYQWRIARSLLEANFKKDTFGAALSGEEKALADRILHGNMPYNEMKAALNELSGIASAKLYTVVDNTDPAVQAKWVKRNPDLAGGLKQHQVGRMKGNKAE